MDISFLEIFTLISIVHCFLLSLILLQNKYLKNDTNKYLGYTLLVIAVIGCNNWFWDLNKNPTLIQFLDFFLWQFIYPVTLYLFFIKALKHPIKRSYKKLLFLPFLALSLMNIVVTLQNIYNVFHLPFLSTAIISSFYKMISFVSILFPLVFLFLSFKLLFTTKKKHTKWLQLLWVFFLIIEIYGLALEFHRFLYLERKSLNYLWIGISILLYWLIYIGIYQFKLSNEKYEIRRFLNTKKSTSQINAKENQHIQLLLSLFLNEKMHHNSLLNRELIAEKLGISSGYLSQLIRQTEYNNLSTLISHFRIEDVKQMIVHPDFSNYNLLSIGLEAGFSSKATFYNAFKKATGITPNAYRKQHL